MRSVKAIFPQLLRALSLVVVIPVSSVAVVCSTASAEQTKTAPSSILVSASQPSLAAFRETFLYLSARAAEEQEQKPAFTWHALAKGSVAAPAYNYYSGGRRDPEAYRENQRLAPDEMALLLQREYGAGSLLSRGATSIAGFAMATEKSAQLSLDGVNMATESVIDNARKAFDMPYLPDLNLRSTIRGDRVDVGIRKNW